MLNAQTKTRVSNAQESEALIVGHTEHRLKSYLYDVSNLVLHINRQGTKGLFRGRNAESFGYSFDELDTDTHVEPALRFESKTRGRVHFPKILVIINSDGIGIERCMTHAIILLCMSPHQLDAFGMVWHI
jgi:hypothetical protein